MQSWWWWMSRVRFQGLSTQALGGFGGVALDVLADGDRRDVGRAVGGDKLWRYCQTTASRTLLDMGPVVIDVGKTRHLLAVS